LINNTPGTGEGLVPGSVDGDSIPDMIAKEGANQKLICAQAGLGCASGACHFD
jgi:hypothetical protein